MRFNTIMRNIGLLSLALALSTVTISCDPIESVPDDSDIAIDALGLRGTWVVDMYWDGDYYDTNTIRTFNTSDNSTTEMWLDDIGHGWGLLSKVPLNADAMTFNATDLDELYYGVTVTITESQITKNGATTPSGDVVDSITFTAAFSDGATWEYTGYKSTAKVEDYQ